MSFEKYYFALLPINLRSTALICLLFACTSLSFVHAEDLYTTDSYLEGLDAEVDDEYTRDINKSDEGSQATSPADIRKALESRFNFEELLRIKHNTSYVIYTKLSTSDRILIFEKFKNTKKLSAAKRMIIDKFE